MILEYSNLCVIWMLLVPRDGIVIMTTAMLSLSSHEDYSMKGRHEESSTCRELQPSVRDEVMARASLSGLVERYHGRNALILRNFVTQLLIAALPATPSSP